MIKFNNKDVTFANSKETPFQRWYPYVEGYSPSFVEGIIEQYCPKASLIYEPFAGTGTTIFASDNKNIDTIYSEVNPLLVFIIQVKIKILRMDGAERINLSESLRLEASHIINKISKASPSKSLETAYKRTFGKSKYFDDNTFNQILKFRRYIDRKYNNGQTQLADLLTISALSCLLPISYLKKQGDVRFKTAVERKRDMKTLEEVLPSKINEIADDVANLQYKLYKNHTLVTPNAKDIGAIHLKSKISAVITSPPYLNGTNYFRNTKLELWFLKFLKKESDLRDYRDEALTSGINDVKREYKSVDVPFKSIILNDTLNQLENYTYDSRIPLMAKCYFNEMYQMFNGLTKSLKKGASVFVDLGDSIFSNVHIKTDYILSDVISQLGFVLKERIVLRQRRSRNGEMLSQVLLVFQFK